MIKVRVIVFNTIVYRVKRGKLGIWTVWKVVLFSTWNMSDCAVRHYRFLLDQIWDCRFLREKDRQRERQTDRQTDRQSKQPYTRERTRRHTHTHIHTFIHTYIYIAWVLVISGMILLLMSYINLFWAVPCQNKALEEGASQKFGITEPTCFIFRLFNV